MATEYRIVDWDERYEVDDKGRPWEQGRTKRSGPLEFIRLTTFGLEPSNGWKGLIEVAGKHKAMRIFGLFCKLLEIAGNKPRERRNRLPGPEAVAFALHLPVRQVLEGYEILMRPEVRWVEPFPETPGTSGNLRELPENPQPTNQPTNRTNSTNTTNRAGARASGDGSGAANAASVADANHWATTKQLVRAAFGKDSGLSRAMDTIGNSLLSDRARADEASRTIRALIREAKDHGDAPKAYFMGCLRRRFRCLQ